MILFVVGDVIRETLNSLSPQPTAGFGLGALNEAEDDDVDIYDSTSHADRTYMPYDAIRDADEGPGVSRKKATQKVVR